MNMTGDSPVSPQPTCAVLVDVDRTLLNTDAFSQIIYKIVNEIGVGQEVIDQVAKEQASAYGQAFDYIARLSQLVPELTPGGMHGIVLDYMADRYLDSKTGLWQGAFIDRIMADGASELIDGLHGSLQHQPVLCTSGGVDTQKLKLEILRGVMGYDIPWIVVGVSQQRKAHMVSMYYDGARGVFDLESYANAAQASQGIHDNPALANITRVEVIDDKLSNTSDIRTRSPVRGWLVQVAESDATDSSRYSLEQVNHLLLHHTIDK